MSIIGPDGSSAVGIANIANLKCCCSPTLCNACPPGQDLPSSFYVMLNIGASSNPFSPTFARFNTTNTVTYNASHTGHFGTAYAGWFYTSGIDDGAHDYTEVAVVCAGALGLEIKVYRFLVSPPPTDSLNGEGVGCTVGPGDASYACSPLFMLNTSPVFLLGGDGGFGEVRTTGSIVIAP